MPEPAHEKVPFFGARKYAEQLQHQIDELGAADLMTVRRMTEEAQTSFAVTKAQQEQQLAGIGEQIRHARAELQELNSQLLDVRTAYSLQDNGLYNFAHPAESSVELSNELATTRADIKRCLAHKEATTAVSGFTFNNSSAKGKSFVNQMSKMMLAAYNAEAENAIKAVRAGNLETALARLARAAARVEKNGAMIELRITAQYQKLREQELTLAAQHMQALQFEKEEERARKQELREQKQAEAELARERLRLENERAKYLRALEGLRERGDEEAIAELEDKIHDVDQAIEDVDYRKANARAGFVYVISNIGSFGEGIVKIGMTRRLEPLDRVRELGDASVPFRFDVHALIFSDDAVSLETTLHHEFDDRRINRVNLRREYFRATPTEVLEALKKHHAPVVEFTLDPAAEEYRLSSGVAT